MKIPMTHQLKPISVCILLFICLFIPVSAEIDVAHFSLKHPISYSPDGKSLVMIVEDRYVGGSLFGLTLLDVHGMVSTKDGSVGLSSDMYALTPDYKEVVAIPGSTHFAYVRYDPRNSYSVHLFMPETGDQRYGIATASASSTLEQLQFSKDGKYFCFYAPNAPHPFASAAEKRRYEIRRMLQEVDSWGINALDNSLAIKTDEYQVYRGTVFSLTREGIERTSSLTEAEKDAFTEWAPIEKPNVIPQIFTQPMPKITLETVVQWAPPDPVSDAVPYIYVSDDTGIWCVSLREPLPVYVPMWTKLVNAERIHRFQVSPTGRHLVYEVKPDLANRIKAEQQADPLGLENDIWLVELAPFLDQKPKQDPMEWDLDVTAELSSIGIAKGWGAIFNSNGRFMIYSNTEETNIIDLKTMKHHWLGWSGKR